jgi:cell division protein FtsQ
LVRLEAPAPTRIVLRLAGGRQIVWGDSSDNQAKARVATSLLARPGTVIDVSAPDVVTVR